jgi:hypothetical protein
MLISSDLAAINVTAATVQTITSVGVTNLTGSNDGTVDINALNSTLNNAGGVWTDDVQVGMTGFTENVTINNSGAITVIDVDDSHVHVIADAGAGTMTLDNVGSVGTTGDNERLVTSTNTIIFDDTNKNVALDERVGDVSIEGVIDALNLILTDAAGGNLTDSGDLTANMATLLITNGDIDLSANMITVDTFTGLIANLGDIVLSLAGDTTLTNRDESFDIPAGAGIFADGDIDITSTDNVVVTADAVLSEAGDISFSAANLILNAENASVGGVNGPTGAVGTITSNDGIQTYDTPVTLLTNTLISATGTSDTVSFNGILLGPGGLEIGSTPIFNAAIGSLNNPLAYLILNSAGTQFNYASGATDPSTIGLDDAVLTAIIGGSFINNGVIDFTQAGENYTIVTDANTFGTVSNPDAVFQGGDILGLDAADLTLFVGAIDSVSATSGLPDYDSFYSSWQIENELSALTLENGNIFQFAGIFYRDSLNPLAERDLERVRRLGYTKTAQVAYDDSSVNLTGSRGVGSDPASSFSSGSFGVTQTVFEDVIILP